MAAAASPRSERPLSRLLGALALAILVAVFVLAVVVVREVRRGEAFLAASDAAFHANDLVTAVVEARSAGLAFVPGAAHVRAAEERLEAVARGAEAEGNRELARRAWDALRVVAEETNYPGRGPNPAEERAKRAIERLDGIAK